MRRPFPTCRSLATGARAISLVVILLLPALLDAQDGAPLPTRGKRFWTGFMQNGFGAQNLRIHILGTTATSGTVSIPRTGWSAPFTVAANGVVVVNVPTTAENQGSETVRDKGVLVQAQDSVNVFISSFQNFTHDLTQVLPEGSLGDDYRVDAYHGLPNFGNLHKSELLIVATQDGTQVRITPSVNTLGGRPAGVPFTLDLNAGQTYQVQAAQDVLDLTGTTVEATANSGNCRPFAVIGGSMCATVPGSCSACDAIFTQLAPRRAWGTRYFTVPVLGVTGSTYRILADEDNTQVSIGGGPPINLNAGQRHTVHATAVPVCVQANKPVSVAQLMEGYSCAGNGDPSLMLISPAERMSTRALFHTPTSGQLNQHSISLVVPPASVGQLTLNGTVVNPALFQPYAGCADRLHAKVPVPAGIHRVEAANGFQLYALGIGYGESYAASAHDIGGTNVPQDSIVCGGGPITLNSPEPLDNAWWSTASDPNTVAGTGNSLTITPTSSESYTVTGEQPLTGCPASFTFHVGIPLTIPTLPTANGAPTTSACTHAPVQLRLVPPPDPAWFTIRWSPTNTLDDPTIANPVARPLEDTWYRVEVSSPSGCGDMVDSVLVLVDPGEVLELTTTVSRDSICLGEPVQLVSSALRVIANDRFNGPPAAFWSALQGGTVSGACGSVTGTALYFNGNGQRSAQTSGLNTMGGGEVRFHLKISDGAAPCDNADPGEDVVLEYSTNNGLNWSTMRVFAENAFPAFTAVRENIPPPARTANTMFRLRQMAHSGAGQDNWAVDDFLVARYDNTWLNLAWSPAAAVANPNAPSTTAHPVASGWYTLRGTDPLAGCVYSDSVHVHVAPAFTLKVTSDTTLCDAGGLRLDAVPSFNTTTTWAWSPNNGTLSAANIPSPFATPQSTTTYTVSATTATGCTATGQVTVTVGRLLSLTASAADSALCQGQSTQLNAVASGAAGLGYQWTGAGLDNPGIANPLATPAQTTTYTVTVTDTASGCSLTASVTVRVTTGYTADAGPDLTLCSALGQQLTVQHNVPNPTYQWAPAGNLNSATIQSPTILSDATATYTVTVTDANGCAVSDQVTVTRAFDGLPPNNTANACADAPPTLSAPMPGTGYLWSTGQTTPAITPATSGSYTLTITDAQGCQGTTTFHVTLFALPVVDLGPDLALCGATGQLLDAGNPGSTYLWNTGAVSRQLNAVATGSYSVTVTTAQGCQASDAVHVAFNDLPVNTLRDTTACETAPPVLDAGNAGSTYLWSTGTTTRSVTATASGAYSVTVTTPHACSATFSATVVLAPTVSVGLINDTSICAGQGLTLDAGAGGPAYLWSTGATSRTITVNSAGTYRVSVTNGHCSASDSTTISVVPSPVNALNDVTTCEGRSVTLDAGNPGSTFQWTTGSMAPAIDVTVSGSYGVTVTNAHGCTASFTATVLFVPPPSVELGMDTVLCHGQVLTLDAGNPGSTYAWSTGAATRDIRVSVEGTYAVVVDNGHCQRGDTITVRFNPVPERTMLRQVLVCLDEEPRYASLDAGNTGSTFRWSNGDTTRVARALDYGWHRVDITNAYGCSLRDSVSVEEHCPASLFIPNTFTPDGDGRNDVFLAVGVNIASFEMAIFDRWGRLLFESFDPGTGWDGRFQGSPVKNDMYVWKVKYRLYEGRDGAPGREQERMGHVQVLR